MATIQMSRRRDILQGLLLAVLRRIPLPELPAAAGNFEGATEGSAEKLPATAGNLEDFCRRSERKVADVGNFGLSSGHPLGDAGLAAQNQGAAAARL